MGGLLTGKDTAQQRSHAIGGAIPDAEPEDRQLGAAMAERLTMMAEGMAGR